MAKLTKKDYKYFDMARRVAETSTFEGFHLGCVMVYKGHVLSTGANSDKTHPMQRRYNKKYRKFNKSTKPIKDSLHAEMTALTTIPYPIDQTVDYSQVKVYIYRICHGKPLQLGLARPCAACRAALHDKGIRHLYYTGEASFIYEELV